MNIAYVNLFEFSLGIGIQIGEERYNLINGNAESILQMIQNYDIDSLILVGPEAITEKYEKDLNNIMKSDYSKYKNIKITCVEDN